MAGFDPKDSTSLDVAVPDFEATLTRDLKGLRVGIPREYRVDGMPAEIENLWAAGVRWLRDVGAEIVDVSRTHTHHALATYYIVAHARVRRTLAALDAFPSVVASRRRTG